MSLEDPSGSQMESGFEKGEEQEREQQWESHGQWLRPPPGR